MAQLLPGFAVFALFCRRQRKSSIIFTRMETWLGLATLVRSA